MIEDFTNPHGGLVPKKEITRSGADVTNFRIKRIQGMYHVQRHNVKIQRLGFYIDMRKEWKDCTVFSTGNVAAFQTFQEAENFILKCCQPEKEYYF